MRVCEYVGEEGQEDKKMKRLLRARSGRDNRRRNGYSDESRSVMVESKSE